jgi:thioredoxin 1
MKILYFGAKWCGPCQMLSPIIAEITKEREDIEIVKIDIDENFIIADSYNIMSVPVLLFLKDDNVFDKIHGLTTKQSILDIIEKNT